MELKTKMHTDLLHAREILSSLLASSSSNLPVLHYFAISIDVKLMKQQGGGGAVDLELIERVSKRAIMVALLENTRDERRSVPKGEGGAVVGGSIIPVKLRVSRGVTQTMEGTL